MHITATRQIRTNLQVRKKKLYQMVYYTLNYNFGKAVILIDSGHFHVLFVQLIHNFIQMNSNKTQNDGTIVQVRVN